MGWLFTMTGGHGVMFDFTHATALAELTAQFYESNNIVSAMAHGPWRVAGSEDAQRRLSHQGEERYGLLVEEVLAKRDQAVLFSLEEELHKRGATYRKARLPFVPHVVEDGLLITGQNPASPKAVGEAVVRKLQVMR